MPAPRQLLLCASLLLCPPLVGSLHAQPFPAPRDSATARLMQRLATLSADSMEGRRTGTPGSARARAW
ncbi:MAG: peptidase M28, partial [Gemmatimonas sp.]